MAHDSVIYLPTKHDYAELTQVWEASVRATHDFLPENYITLLRHLLETQYLDTVKLFGTRDSRGHITGFAGISRGKLEMLFIAPDCRGMGLGKMLLDHAIKLFQVTDLDVNEQNPQALGFYEKQGFVVVGRSEVDGLGRPYPMLRMRLAQNG